MMSTGMAVLIGHGVPRQTVDEMYETALEFFELEHAQKMESCLNVGYGAGGFVPMGVEVTPTLTTRAHGCRAACGHNRALTCAHGAYFPHLPRPPLARVDCRRPWRGAVQRAPGVRPTWSKTSSFRTVAIRHWRR
eukprot:6260915-Prymnesium_polylepis.2